MSTQSNVRFLLITANTGTIFEKPELVTIWLAEFARLLREHPSDFVALHCQEVGGKDYERFMHILDPFIKDLLRLPEISADYTRYRLYFDSDYTSQDTFTALGSAYFIRHNVPVQQWNFITSSFQPVVNRQIFAGNLVNAQTLRKEKYPREFFPEAKWSRKGFTQTRWSINGFAFDLVNVHLFHDASNLLAAEHSPSVYSKFRKNALQYTLRKLPLDSSSIQVPFAMFGDFNFRLDAHRFLEHIVEKPDGSIDKIKQPESNEISRIVIRNADNKLKLTIEKKEFNLHDDHDAFFHTNTQQIQVFDFESSEFDDELFEYEKDFPPSYPYSEEHDEGRSYLRARCPAWCDRILLSHSFKDYVDIETSRPTYNIVGQDVCMGDHKPVYLALTIRLVQGSSSSPSSSLARVFSSSSFPNCKHRVATADMLLCEPFVSNSNPTKSFVTVERKSNDDDDICLILNEIQLPTSDNNLEKYNIHDYAIFVQSSLLPQWWFVQLRQRPLKNNFTHNNSSGVLWAKVRAVTYMTTLAHRHGSWYSDDRTEDRQIDDDDDDHVSSSANDDDKQSQESEIPESDFQDYKSDLVMPLRRSYSSINILENNDISFKTLSTLSRSHSITAIDTMNLPETPIVIESTSSRLSRFLRCVIL